MNLMAVILSISSGIILTCSIIAMKKEKAPLSTVLVTILTTIGILATILGLVFPNATNWTIGTQINKGGDNYYFDFDDCQEGISVNVSEGEGVTIDIKKPPTADSDADISMDIVVRKTGQKDWLPVVFANEGDVVEFQISYMNFSDTVQDVMARVVLPTNLSYVDDSTVLYNSNHKEGITMLENSLATTGVNIGNYKYKGNAFLRFRAIVVDRTLVNGQNILVCNSSFTVNNTVSHEAAAVAVVK